MDAELEFAIQPNTTGKQLFDQVGVCELVRESSRLEKNVCNMRIILFAKRLPWLAACFSLQSRSFFSPIKGFNCVKYSPGLVPWSSPPKREFRGCCEVFIGCQSQSTDCPPASGSLHGHPGCFLSSALRAGVQRGSDTARGPI